MYNLLTIRLYCNLIRSIIQRQYYYIMIVIIVIQNKQEYFWGKHVVNISVQN